MPWLSGDNSNNKGVYNTQQSRNFLPFSMSGAMSDTRDSTILVYFVINSYYSQCFLFCHCSYACTCLDHKLQTRFACAIKSCLPCVYPWRHIRDKMNQAFPLLSGESLRMRLEICHHTMHTCSVQFENLCYLEIAFQSWDAYFSCAISRLCSHTTQS